MPSPDIDKQLTYRKLRVFNESNMSTGVLKLKLKTLSFGNVREMCKLKLEQEFMTLKVTLSLKTSCHLICDMVSNIS